ncbi:MAG: acetyl-CoA C-acyltransferase, partial [Marinomonas sp.]
MTRRAAIVSPLRTPVGKFLGTLAPMNAGELGGIILKALIERSGIDPARVDDVVFSQGYGNGEAPCIGHWSWLAAGLPLEVPGYQLDRRCGSGVQAIANAAMMVETGMADVVVAGGCESMSNVEHYTTAARGGARMGDMTLHDRLSRGRVMSQPIERFGAISGMIETAENLAADYDISREECDQFAVRSHQNAAAAWEAGKFDEQLVPIEVPQRRKDPIQFNRDEGFRADATLESLGKLRALEGKQNPAAVVTAGNASQQNDAAAACLVVAEDKLEELGLTPMLWFGGWAAAGC